VEEECLQTLVEDRKWRGWLDIHQ